MSLEKLSEEMKLRGFTRATQKAYTWNLKKFSESGLEKREYLLSIIHKSSASVRLAAAAISFYEKEILREKSEYVSIPKKEGKLPRILSKQQVIAMVAVTDNEKHKAT